MSIYTCSEAVYDSLTIGVLLIYSVRASVSVCAFASVRDDFDYRLLCLCFTLYSNEGKHYARIVALVVTVDCQCMRPHAI